MIRAAAHLSHALLVQRLHLVMLLPHTRAPMHLQLAHSFQSKLRSDV